MNNLFNFKSFFKFLDRNKVYTLINVFGLSLSLMFVILISIYVKQELSIDNFHEKGDQIYIMANEEFAGSAFRLAYRMQERFPEIEKVCPTVPFWQDLATNIGDRKYDADALFADSTFFDMFSFRLLEGRKEDVLQSRNYAVISETFAKTAFSDVDPIGQTVQVNDSVTLIVSGVMKDIKNSIFPYADILIRIDNIKFFNSSMDSERFENAGSCVVFVQKRENADLQAKEADMLVYLKEIFWIYRNGLQQKINFIPLKDYYFSQIESPGLKQGDKRFVLVLLSVSILILIFAIINYINLTVAQAGFRAKEMATRRLHGSSRTELFIKLILESTFMTLISFLIAFLLALAVVPYANDLLQTRIDIMGSMNLMSISIIVGLILIIGTLSGILPASIISNSKPIEVVRGEFRQKTKMRFSKVFITFQNVITIIMIASSITMIAQVRHLITAPLGYNSTNLMDIPVFENKDRQLAFGQELERLSCVKRVAYSRGTPFSRGNNNTVRYDNLNKNISFQIIVSDQTFFDMLNLQVIKDNNYSGTDGYYLTEQAARELELDADAKEFSFHGGMIPIRGIIKDFKLYNITQQAEAILYRIMKVEEMNFWNLIVEVQGDPFKAYNEIKDAYERFTELEFKGEYFDQQIQKSFESQARISKIVSIFTVIAIVISTLGLIAMSAYFILQRSREIAVRKVFGSTNTQMLRRLVFKFLNYVFIAFVIAVPIIWYLMTKWLSDYSYRIELSPLIFIAAGVFCLLISFIAVFIQSYYAANSNPIKRIKAE